MIDFILISKVLILMGLYFILSKIYKNFDFNSSAPIDFLNFKKPIQILVLIVACISAFSIFMSFVVSVFLVIAPGFYNYLETRPYWDQIIILFGFIAFYFVSKMRMDEISEKKQKQKELITSQKSRINQLENDLRTTINTLEEKTLPKLTENERARIIAFRNTMERRKDNKE
ncbi:hypothetical protein [Aureibaculum luteum]|uniref:hypothetical protein n=1 Tax=Aureibaculum luteum TaxID=1548456 RepID=UPI001300235D|nr:hypothetical protein [Aureibaculum luteum]